jgi:hypothetical protein
VLSKNNEKKPIKFDFHFDEIDRKNKIFLAKKKKIAQKRKAFLEKRRKIEKKKAIKLRKIRRRRRKIRILQKKRLGNFFKRYIIEKKKIKRRKLKVCNNYLYKKKKAKKFVFLQRVVFKKHLYPNFLNIKLVKESI